MKLIKYFFDCLSEYRILKTKCSIQLEEVRSELRSKTTLGIDDIIMYVFIGILCGNLMNWIGYFIYN